MAVTLFERGAAKEKEEKPTTGIVTGFVTNDCDLVMQGKIRVRIPTLDKEVWARLGGIGASSGAGFFYSPRNGDEVLLGITSTAEPIDAYLICSLWGTAKRPPISIPKKDAQTKRILKTGLAGGVGHEVEFDDLLQKISITSSTQQKILIDPVKIEISNTVGTLKITLDNETQTVTIEGVSVEIKGAAALKLSAPAISIQADGALNLKAGAACIVKGATVQINPPG
jgi:uncharacterized protein involved in type VI secretion and phage assembly